MTDTLGASEGLDTVAANQGADSVGATDNTDTIAAAGGDDGAAAPAAPAAKPDKRSRRARARAAGIHPADDGPPVAVVLKTSKLRDREGEELVRGTVAMCPERKADRLVANRKVRFATEREVARAGLLRHL